MLESQKQGVEAPVLNTHEETAGLVERLEKAERELAEERALRQELEKQHEEDLKTIASLEKLAMVDPLTGLYNRYGGQKGIESMVDARRAGPEDRERRTKKSERISILALDIDHFKSVNDTYGHAAGDTVLKAVAEKLKRGFRSGDLVVREGGEEIFCVLDGLDARTAYNVLFQKFGNAERDIKPGDHPQIGFLVEVQDADGAVVKIPVTFSGGIVDFGKDDSFESVKAVADQLLYKAKQDGRNRILISETAHAGEDESSPKNKDDAERQTSAS